MKSQPQRLNDRTEHRMLTFARLIRAKKTHSMDLILSILAASVCNLWLVEFGFEGCMRCRQLLVHSAPI